jgi:hypothetical protein
MFEADLSPAWPAASQPGEIQLPTKWLQIRKCKLVKTEVTFWSYHHHTNIDQPVGGCLTPGQTTLRREPPEKRACGIVGSLNLTLKSTYSFIHSRYRLSWYKVRRGPVPLNEPNQAVIALGTLRVRL